MTRHRASSSAAALTSGQRPTTHASVVEAWSTATKRVFARFTLTTSEAPDDAGRHTLLLTPKSGGAALPVGWIDPSSRRAELLTLGAVVASSKGALGKELAVPPREHARLVEVTEATLRPYDIAVDVVRRLTAPVPVTRAAASGPRHTLPYGRRVEVAPIAVGRLAIRGGR